MFGIGYIETEGLNHKKIISLGENWWLMFASDDASQLFPIIDSVRKLVKPKMSATNMGDCVFCALAEQREKVAERKFLIPRSMTIDSFQKFGLRRLGSEIFREIGSSMIDLKLGMQLLVCGFDAAGRATIILIDDEGTARCDVPGFSAIGSGQFGATYMMFYRDLSTTMPLRQVLYYSVEAKSFGEQAGGVSEDTDLYVIRDGMPPIIIETDQLDKEVFPLCLKLSPGNLRTETNIKALNSINLGDSVAPVVLDKMNKKLISSNLP
jgi:hypothetical protein